MPEYKIESPVLHDGKKYLPGAMVAMDEKTAAPLLAVSAISRPSVSRPNAGDTIALVKDAATLEALGELTAGEERKSVLAAIESRRKELTPDGDK